MADGAHGNTAGTGIRTDAFAAVCLCTGGAGARCTSAGTR